MKKNKLKKVLALVVAATIGATLLVGCGDDSKKESSEQVLTYNLGADSKTLDPALNTAVDGGIVIANAFEGLCRTDENDKAIEGGANSWTILKRSPSFPHKLILVVLFFVSVKDLPIFLLILILLL